MLKLTNRRHKAQPYVHQHILKAEDGHWRESMLRNLLPKHINPPLLFSQEL